MIGLRLNKTQYDADGVKFQATVRLVTKRITEVDGEERTGWGRKMEDWDGGLLKRE
jgi:hypothetical protein